MKLSDTLALLQQYKYKGIIVIDNIDAAIAKLLEVDRSSVTKWRTGLRFPKFDEVIKYEDKVVSKLLKKLNNPKEIEQSVKKVVASFKATEARTKAAKEKIQNEINILRMENKKITHYSVAQTSGVSFTTVKKYLDDDTLKSLNEVE